MASSFAGLCPPRARGAAASSQPLPRAQSRAGEVVGLIRTIEPVADIIDRMMLQAVELFSSRGRYLEIDPTGAP